MSIQNFIISVLFILLIATSGCKDSAPGDSDDLASMQRAEIETFIDDNNLTATRHDDGFYFSVVKDSADGRTQSEGKILGIYYSMSILGGQEISFYLAGNGAPLRLKQGENAVVPVGLDTGLDLMREGEVYRFILPSNLAFGDLEFSTLIPLNSIIDVEVELATIENDNDISEKEALAIDTYVSSKGLNNLTANPVDSVEILSSGLRFKKMVTDSTNTNPGAGLVTITYEGTFLDDVQFDATTGNDVFKFSVGAGEVVAGLDEGVGRMKIGERALLIMPSSLAYGGSARVIPNFLTDDMIERQVIPDYVARVSPYRVLIFDVRLTQ